MINTALLERLVFRGPFDIYWVVGLLTTLALAVAFGLFVWYDRKSKQSQ